MAAVGTSDAVFCEKIAGSSRSLKGIRLGIKMLIQLERVNSAYLDSAIIDERRYVLRVENPTLKTSIQNCAWHTRRNTTQQESRQPRYQLRTPPDLFTSIITRGSSWKGFTYRQSADEPCDQDARRQALNSQNKGSPFSICKQKITRD